MFNGTTFTIINHVVNDCSPNNHHQQSRRNNFPESPFRFSPLIVPQNNHQVLSQHCSSTKHFSLNVSFGQRRTMTFALEIKSSSPRGHRSNLVCRGDVSDLNKKQVEPLLQKNVFCIPVLSNHHRHTSPFKASGRRWNALLVFPCADPKKMKQCYQSKDLILNIHQGQALQSQMW